MIRPLILLSVVFLLISGSPRAAEPVWQGKGRIAISSDGNEHDHDDWAASPFSMALIAAKGLQNKLVLYTYSDHIWGSNGREPMRYGMSAYDHMKESVLGAKREFGFDKTKFICAVDNPEAAYKAMVDVINASSAGNPLIIIAAGPMQVIGEAIHRASPPKLKYVTIITHSEWNNNHSDQPELEFAWDRHQGWTLDEIEKYYSAARGSGVKIIRIVDQNGGEGYEGLRAPVAQFDWVKTSPARSNDLYKPGSWDWLYGRLQTGLTMGGKQIDASDTGMIVYMFTGEEKTNVGMAREIMENPQPKLKR